MNRMRWAAVLVAGLATTGVACSGGDYSKADFQKDLEEEVDLKPEVAKCVTDGVDDAGIDISEFNTDKSMDEVLDADEQKEFTEVITACVMEDSGIDPSEMPDASDLTVPEGG